MPPLIGASAVLAIAPTVGLLAFWLGPGFPRSFIAVAGVLAAAGWAGWFWYTAVRGPWYLAVTCGLAVLVVICVAWSAMRRTQRFPDAQVHTPQSQRRAR